MPLAVTVTTWLQVAGTLIAAAAALASWAAVVQARKAAEDARQAEHDAALPLLLILTSIVKLAAGHSSLTVAVYNASGGIAQDVSILVVGENAYARGVEGFLRPGETISYSTDVEATTESRAGVYGRTADRREFVWNPNALRRELASADSPRPSWEMIFAAFYDDAGDLDSLRPTQLLRAAF